MGKRRVIVAVTVSSLLLIAAASWVYANYFSPESRADKSDWPTADAFRSPLQVTHHLHASRDRCDMLS